ncbi:MAG TPA: CoA pyrophosphatase [Tenuifilaceae bacterium]|nr:CoA pyrophosphatase [Tenuifilaceae bacterium]
MFEFTSFCTKLKFLLTQTLPGNSAQQQMAPSLREDLRGNSTPNTLTRQSAVLILIFPSNNNTPYSVLIKRQTYNGPHSGQISLPGGKTEDYDDDIIKTALREANEEIGINKNDIKVLGTLTNLYIPISNIMVKPVVGYVEYEPTFTPNLQEVEYIISFPIFSILNSDSKSVKVISSHGRPITAPYYNIQGEMVWGATAMILSEFENVLRQA